MQIDPVILTPDLKKRRSNDFLQGITGYEGVTKDINTLNSFCGDGSQTGLSKCTRPSCVTCSSYKPTDYFCSTSTHRMYKVNNKEWPSVVDCNTSNFIYLITCNCCGIQYVGETGQNMKDRFQKHRTDIKKGKKRTHLVQHFNKGRCKNATYTIHIIENIEGTGQFADGKVNPDFIPARRSRETEWMLAMRTIFPYGLNEKIGESGNLQKLQEEDGMVGKKFPKLPRANIRSDIKRDNNKIDYSSFDRKQFLDTLVEKLKHDLKNAPNYIRVALFSMHKKQLKDLANHFRELLEEKGEDFLLAQWCLMAIDIINTRLYNPLIKKK